MVISRVLLIFELQMLTLLLASSTVVVAADNNYYVVDEPTEYRSRTDLLHKERIVIGYLAGTSLLHDSVNDAMRTTKTTALAAIARPPPPDIEALSSSPSTFDWQKLLIRRRKRHTRNGRRLSKRNSLMPSFGNQKSTFKCSENFIGMDVTEQAKCWKNRPASMFLQGQLVSGALRYAVEKINEDDKLLPNHTLEFKFIDTRGIPQLSVRAFMELWSKGATAFIGPEDSCQTEAMMAASQNMPMVSHKCFDHTVSDKGKYPTFARTAPAESEISKAVISLLKHYKWKNFAIVHGNNDVGKNLLEAIKSDAKSAGLKVLNVTDYVSPFTAENLGPERIKQIISETHTKTRIYVVFGDLKAVRHMLYEMAEQHLFKNGVSEYVIVYVDPAFQYISPDDASINQIYRSAIDIQIDEFNALPEFNRIIELSKSLVMIIPTPVQFLRKEYDQFTNVIVKYVTEPPFQFFKSTIAQNLNYQLRFNRYASYLYDAVYLYARALHEVLLEGGSSVNGTAIISKILNQSYMSMQGFSMKIDENGDALGNYTLLTRQVLSNSMYSLSHGMVQTGHFIQTNDTLPALQLIDKLSIDWATPDGLVPKDMPDCGFLNEFCIKEKNYIVEIICGVFAGVIFVCTIVGFSMYRNRKYEQELAGLIWKIDHRDIQFHPCPGLSGVAGSRMTIASQDSGDGENMWPANPTGLAMYKGSLVAIKTITYARKVREITRATKIEMKNMRNLHHDNVNSFMGIILESNCIRVVREYCAKGSLFDVLLNENIKLDQLFVASFVDDLLKGMIYLHDSELRIHGNLKSTNCVISSRWSLQVADFGLNELRDGQEFESEDSLYFNLLWLSPELLREDALQHPPKGTQPGDVYAFAVILHEILSRKGPFDIYKQDCELTAKDVVVNVFNECNFSFRPNVADLDLQGYMIETMESCWDEMPPRRPDFRFIRQRLKPLFKGILKRNIMDHMITMMEKYQTHLEELVDERTEELKEEKKRIEILLNRMLPKSVASQLMNGDDVLPESYDSVTIYFSDIVGFTSISSDSTPMEVVQFLNALYTLFDKIIRQCDVYKVETIGDAYMVVSGLPIRNGDKHAGEIATMALQLLEKVKEFQIPHRKEQPCLLRIGIHTGPCVAGVVGRTMPRYCLFGDTVNTASRMESNGMPLKIHISESTYSALEKLGGYVTEERGLVPMKGKGEMRTYWLLDKTEMHPISTDSFPSPHEDALFPHTKSAAGRHKLKGNMADQSAASVPNAQSNESLTSAVRRSPPKRVDQPSQQFANSGTRGSRLLLHQRSVIGQDTHVSSPPILRGFSRLLAPKAVSPITGDVLSKMELLAKKVSKRASEVYSPSQESKFITSLGENITRMRKRSMSYPDNVQALAEQLIVQGLDKDGQPTPLLQESRTQSGTISSNKSVNKTTKKKESIFSLPNQAELLSAHNFDKRDRAETNPAITSPLLLDLEEPVIQPLEVIGQHKSSLLLQSVPIVRKRSMSCGDAHIPVQLSLANNACKIDGNAIRGSEGNAVFLNADKKNNVLFYNNSPVSPTRKESEGENNNQLNEDEDYLAESPLLFNSQRFKNKRKSVGSINSPPKHLRQHHQQQWYPNGDVATGSTFSMTNGGSMPKLSRLLNYFKLPSSDDSHNVDPEPSMV